MDVGGWVIGTGGWLDHVRTAKVVRKPSSFQVSPLDLSTYCYDEQVRR